MRRCYRDGVTADEGIRQFPLPLADYPEIAGSILDVLRARIALEPFNAIATGIFVLAIVHTFLAARFTDLAHAIQHREDARRDGDGLARRPNVAAELLHFLGEVEVIFGIWVIPLLAAIAFHAGLAQATHYVNDAVDYTEPLFVIVIMALASTRPIVVFAESTLQHVARLGGGTPAAWWITILTIAPVLGSFITEPAAMTIAALLLGRQFFDLQPPMTLRYATLGLLFVNISIGGTLTHFAAPPVLMVARPWGWDTAFMASHFGWRACVAIGLSTLCYFVIFRRELRALRSKVAPPDLEVPAEDVRSDEGALLAIPPWVTVAHLLALAWTVANAHYPALFIGGFLFFIGFMRATAPYQTRLDLKAPLLVGFFLAGLVIHGGLQSWWIAPVLARLGEAPSFVGSTVLTAFNDNALITYLSTLVPQLDERVRIAIVEGAVTGGGLTVIANAPNPAGQALLSPFFGGAVHPLRLLAAAALPTVIAAAAFRLL